MLCLRLYIRDFPLPSTPSEKGPSKMQRTKSMTILHCFSLKAIISKHKARRSWWSYSNYHTLWQKVYRHFSICCTSASKQIYFRGLSSGHVLTLCCWFRMDKHEANYPQLYMQAGTDRSFKTNSFLCSFLKATFHSEVTASPVPDHWCLESESNVGDKNC